jgi:uncharacterized membrane protein YidH (DUF202 family)
MRKINMIALGLLSAGSVFAQDAVSTPDLDTLITSTVNNANTILGAVLTIGGVILAWKLLRKFFSKTG